MSYALLGYMKCKDARYANVSTTLTRQRTEQHSVQRISVYVSPYVRATDISQAVAFSQPDAPLVASSDRIT